MDTVTNALSVFSGWNLYIREYGNGVVFALCFVLAVVVGGFLVRTYQEIGALALWRKGDGTQTACILWWILIAEGLRAFCAFIPLNAGNASAVLSEPVLNAISFGFSVAVVMLATVLMRAVFLFQVQNRIAATLFGAAATIAVVIWWRALWGLLG